MNDEAWWLLVAECQDIWDHCGQTKGHDGTMSRLTSQNFIKSSSRNSPRPAFNQLHVWICETQKKTWRQKAVVKCLWHTQNTWERFRVHDLHFKHLVITYLYLYWDIELCISCEKEVMVSFSIYFQVLVYMTRFYSGKDSPQAYSLTLEPWVTLQRILSPSMGVKGALFVRRKCQSSLKDRSVCWELGISTLFFSSSMLMSGGGSHSRGRWRCFHLQTFQAYDCTPVPLVELQRSDNVRQATLRTMKLQQKLAETHEDHHTSCVFKSRWYFFRKGLKLLFVIVYLVRLK